MTGKSLSYLSSEATQEENATGNTTPILLIEPDNGTLIRLANMVSTGTGIGIPIIADLRDSNDDPLPDDTDLILRVKRPTDDEPVAVSVKENNIAARNSLSVKDQRNEENIDSVKHELRGDAVNVRDKDVLRVEINSSAQIDWDNSELFFFNQAVTEHPYEG